MVYECWAESPDDRPHFHELVATFSGSLEGIAGYLDFSQAGNPPQISNLKPVQLQPKNGHDHLDQLQTVIVSDSAVDVSVDNVTDCNAPVHDITNCNMQIDDVTDCNITSKLKILQIIMWNIGMAQKAKETRSGCLVHIVQ